MPINYAKLKAWRFDDVVQSYSERDVMAYALSLGVGLEHGNPERLAFVYEGAAGGLRVLPTMAVVLGYPGFWMSDPRSGIDATRIVHGENGLRLHHPLPARGTVVGRSRVTGIADKGRNRGAVVTVERTISDAASGQLYATIRHVTFCRGDGGFATPPCPGDEAGEPLPKLPARDPDFSDHHPTRCDAALLYRLHADPNPLHADPVAAASAGFDQPILHGLATYGIAGFAILQRFCAGRPERLRSLDARFTAPVFPGDEIVIDQWGEDGRVRFRARVPTRGAVVLDLGVAHIE